MTAFREKPLQQLQWKQICWAQNSSRNFSDWIQWTTARFTYPSTTSWHSLDIPSTRMMYRCVCVCVCALLLAENLTSCMNFLQTTRKSLGNVALNIITCFSCGVIFTISWTSRRISKTDFVYNEVKLWSYNTYMILLRYKRKTKTKIYHYHQSFYRIHPKQNIWHFSISSFLVAPAGEYGREFQQQCVVC